MSTPRIRTATTAALSSLPDSLLHAANAGRLVPFVGAGVSRAVVDHFGEPIFPTWRELLERGIERLRGDAPRAATSIARDLSRGLDMPRAASRLRRALAGDWCAFLTDTFGGPSSRWSTESLALAGQVWAVASSNIVITTNYDRVLHQAPHEVARWSIESRMGMADLLRHRPAIPTLWQLHGNVDDASAMIVTREDYARLYGSNGRRSRHEVAVQTLQQLFVSHTLLFVGFSLEDEWILEQLATVTKRHRFSEGNHYALFHHRDATASATRLARYNIKVATFSDYGPPLLAALARLRTGASDVTANTDSIIATAPRGTASRAVRAGDLLAWATTSSGPRTQWCRKDGSVIASRPGIFVSDGREIFEVTRESRPVRLTQTDSDGLIEPAAPLHAHIDDAVLVGVTTGRRAGLAPAEPARHGALANTRFERAIAITTCIGNWIFVRVSDSWEGGAHPSWDVSHYVFDLRTFALEHFRALLSREDATLLDRARANAVRLLRARYPWARKDDDTPLDVELAEVYPSLQSNHRVGTGFRFEAWVGHADAEGPGSDHTISLEVKPPGTLKEFRRLGRGPAFSTAAGTLRIDGGYSALPRTGPSAAWLLEAF